MPSNSLGANALAPPCTHYNLRISQLIACYEPRNPQRVSTGRMVDTCPPPEANGQWPASLACAGMSLALQSLAALWVVLEAVGFGGASSSEPSCANLDTW